MVSNPTFHDYRSTFIVVQTFTIQLITGAVYVRPCQRRRRIDDLLLFSIDVLEAKERNITFACGR